jgi:hypothetical protein
MLAGSVLANDVEIVSGVALSLEKVPPNLNAGILTMLIF